MLKLIISGGQTGVDQAALRAARAVGIPTSGTAPKGWYTEAGAAPWLADYGLKQCDSPAYMTRTRMNILHAQGTLIIGKSSSGSEQTWKYAERIENYPLQWMRKFDEAALSAPGLIPSLCVWVEKHGIETLNVAGNRESVSPGIGVRVEEFLKDWWSVYSVGGE